jgi:hypothetical protein
MKSTNGGGHSPQKVGKPTRKGKVITASAAPSSSSTPASQPPLPENLQTALSSLSQTDYDTALFATMQKKLPGMFEKAIESLEATINNQSHKNNTATAKFLVEKALQMAQLQQERQVSVIKAFFESQASLAREGQLAGAMSGAFNSGALSAMKGAFLGISQMKRSDVKLPEKLPPKPTLPPEPDEDPEDEDEDLSEDDIPSDDIFMPESLE